MKGLKLSRLLLLVAGTAALGMCHEGAVAGTLRVIRSMPFPYPHSYGSDLAWDGRYLWTSKAFGDGGASTFAIDPSDGSVARSFGNVVGNIAWDGSHFWITWVKSSLVGEEWTTFLSEVSTDGSVISSVRLGDFPTAYWGAAWSGGSVWVTDPERSAIAEFDPSDGSMISRVSYPGTFPSALEWAEGSLWITDRSEVAIYQVNSSGSLIEKWVGPLGRPAGIAYDGEYFWVLDTTFEDVSLIQVAVPEPLATPAMISAGVSLAIFVLLRQHPRVRHRTCLAIPAVPGK